MKMEPTPFSEAAMNRIPLALLLLAFAPFTQAKEGDTFFCYWVDAPNKQVATTDIFPGDRKMADDMSKVFAMDMTRRYPGKARMYDCAWREEPRLALEELDRFRATHVSNGFRVGEVAWSPMDR
jgi:hypothetical protein